MKKFTYLSIFTLLNYLLQSCTLVFPLIQSENEKGTLVTHSEVMDKYKTKRDVVKGFGIPSNKDKFEGIEIWYYDKGSTSTTSAYGSANTNLNSNTYSGINANTSARANSTTRTYNKYIEFQFENDRVTNWRTKGIDYAEYSAVPTALFSGMLADMLIVLLWYSLNNN